MIQDNLRLYAITDPRYATKRTMVDVVEDALKGGATMIQLREKKMTEASFLAEAKQLASVCHRYKVPLIINDNWRVAIQSGADGVHLGQSDLPEDIGFLKEKHLIVGVTAKTIEQAQTAEKMGADYLGVGALFESSTKTDAKGITFSECRDICNSVEIPAVGIGGITKENLSELEGLPLAGVALVSAVFAAENITENCKELRQIIRDVIA
ncbi:MAG: thiamine phosphate synthase [Lachnospiraceae bacterium]|nr:thiamine phosphate synthase [Lachnospiraceae bacterium]